MYWPESLISLGEKLCFDVSYAAFSRGTYIRAGLANDTVKRSGDGVHDVLNACDGSFCTDKLYLTTSFGKSIGCEVCSAEGTPIIIGACLPRKRCRASTEDSIMSVVFSTKSIDLPKHFQLHKCVRHSSTPGRYIRIPQRPMY